jgi:hypothetical protein
VTVEEVRAALGDLRRLTEGELLGGGSGVEGRDELGIIRSWPGKSPEELVPMSWLLVEKRRSARQERLGATGAPDGGTDAPDTEASLDDLRAEPLTMSRSVNL